MTRLILAAMIGLTTGAALRHAPRDWPEHALALARRMTFNDSGRPEMLPANGKQLSPDLAARAQQCADVSVLCESDKAGQSLNGRVLSGVPVRSRHATLCRVSVRPAVTYVLRMLGLPRMRATVELRP